MPIAIIAGLIARHLLTVAGGATMAAGSATQSPEEQIAGAVIALVGMVWSYVQKKRAGL